MEAARTELLRERGCSYREMEERGFYLPVYEARCRYRKGVQYDDRLVVSSWISGLGGASMSIDYDMYMSGNGNHIIAYGHTRHAFTDKNGRILRVPAFFREMFADDISEDASSDTSSDTSSDVQ
jgi:acyl-CoA thioester hydrolase